MTDNKTTQPQAKFDPTKLEQLNVAKDYPMEPEEFRKLFEYNCYCEMAHINKKGFPIVTPMFYVVMERLPVHEQHPEVSPQGTSPGREPEDVGEHPQRRRESCAARRRS